MTFLPSDSTRRRWTLRLVILGAWALYVVWLAVTGSASGSQIVTMALFVVAVIAAFWVYDRWWNRPIRRSDGAGDAAPPDGGEPAEPRGETGHGMSFDLLFPGALAVTLIGTMALLGFPGGGAGAGLVAIAALGLVGWLALRRSIGG